MLRVQLLVAGIAVAAAVAVAQPVSPVWVEHEAGGDDPRLPVSSSWDTLYWHDYSVPIPGLAHGGPTSGDAWLFGLGAHMVPKQYPAIVRGVSHRVFRDPRSPTQGAMQIRLADDDGPGGAPLTSLRELNTQADTWMWFYMYTPLPQPHCTIWDGSFYLFFLTRDTARISTTLLWARDLYLDHLEEHWWHQNGSYAVCTNIAGDLQMGAVVEYLPTGAREVLTPGNPAGPRTMMIHPNPFRTDAVFRLPAAPGGSPPNDDLRIYDRNGRCVRTLSLRGSATATWDGRDEHGRGAPPGVYLCRAYAGDRTATGIVVKLE